VDRGMADRTGSTRPLSRNPSPQPPQGLKTSLGVIFKVDLASSITATSTAQRGAISRSCEMLGGRLAPFYALLRKSQDNRDLLGERNSNLECAQTKPHLTRRCDSFAARTQPAAIQSPGRSSWCWSRAAR
jgi:hypothetical protein